ncbi:MAG: hypothetical protein WEB06_09435 [Actinomycetota bacterium]
MTVRTVAILWVAIALALIFAWSSVSSGTGHALLKAGPVRRLGRRYRDLWLRGLLWGASWPHLIDRLQRVHRAPVEQTPFDMVWQDGSATLRRLRGARKRPAVLLVHALVSRPWILDLAPGHSLVGALAGAGFDVFVLDWGDAGRADSRRDLAACVATLLQTEERVLAEAGTPAVHLAGYCSGATLCLIRLGGWPHDRIASFAAIAAPVDLAVPGGMRTMMTHKLLKPVLLIDADGCVSAAAIRESFHALRPQVFRSVTRAVRRRRDPEYRRIYDPLSRWAYEQRRIPGALFFDTVELYRTNALYEGRMSVEGRAIDLSSVRTPILVALAIRDHIVPGASSQALGSVLEVETLACPSGHVSMLSGEGGREVLWPGLTQFFHRHDDKPPAASSASKRRKPKRVGPT